MEKAYRLYVNDLSEPWLWNDVIVYAKSAGEAKSKGLKDFDGAEKRDIYKYDGWREVRFTDIKAIRHKDLDKELYSGKLLTKAEIREKKWVEDRDQYALNLSISNPESLVVIYAGCYGQYWGPNRSGYCMDLKYAGKYTALEAYKIVNGSDYSRQEVVKILDKEKYNKRIDSEIKRLNQQKI